VIKDADARVQDIVETALKSESPKGKHQFVEYETQEDYAGAFAKTPYGVTVISQIPLAVVREPAIQARNEAIFITLSLIFTVFFISYVFSLTLTSPIEKLVYFAKQISKGKFNIQVRKNIHVNDEVGDLARAFDGMIAGLQERDKVKSLFSKFHGSSIAEDLINKEVAFGGKNKEVTVFFSDIRGFTAFSENRTPEEVVDMLNEYFSVMVKIITTHHGVVDKFIGDAIMAVWGAPQSTGRDSENAVRACIEMRKALLDLNHRRSARGQPPIKIGMGLHSGHAISGTIGSQERMEYTVIGDAVNMASRIESSTKAFGADLLISETVYQQVKEDFLVVAAGSAEVKGKAEALNLYKVRGFRDANGSMVEVITPFSDYEPEHADKVKVA
jgi:adenylate cyclase